MTKRKHKHDRPPAEYDTERRLDPWELAVERWAATRPGTEAAVRAARMMRHAIWRFCANSN